MVNGLHYFVNLFFFFICITGRINFDRISYILEKDCGSWRVSRTRHSGYVNNIIILDKFCKRIIFIELCKRFPHFSVYHTISTHQNLNYSVWMRSKKSFTKTQERKDEIKKHFSCLQLRGRLAATLEANCVSRFSHYRAPFLNESFHAVQELSRILFLVFYKFLFLLIRCMIRGEEN